MAWTEDRVEQLKQLWSEGLSASQIANAMGGVTRNAVIGKVHRLGLAGRATPTAPKPKAIPVVEEAEVSGPSIRLDMLALGTDKPTVSSLGQQQCKWPIGDPASDEFHFCGQPAQAGKPYCAYHAQLAFQPSAPRRETAQPTTIALPRQRKAAG